jgi:ABC-type molybdate transport system substrate-binding protein
MSDFPAACLRGIRRRDYVKSDKTLSSEVFMPDSRTTATRADKGEETSINWEDKTDGSVVRLTLSDKANAAYGVARVQTARLMDLNDKSVSIGAVTYERDPLEKNPYHGNIVFRSGLDRKVMGWIAQFYTLGAEIILPTDGPT